MTSITIITIVVVALLTAVIFGLAWLGYRSCLRMYQIEIAQGRYDAEIIKEYSHKKLGLVGIIWSFLALLLLSSLFITGLVYRVNNENITIDNKTILVIKSNSMSDFYDDKYAETLSNNRSLQFSIADICVFEKVSEENELIKGEVYGYKYKNIIITHRLVDILDDGTYEFRGDNNPVSDIYHIKRNAIIYHYTGFRISGLGAFILYAQSYFGIWSLLGISGISISSEIVLRKISKMTKRRYREIRGDKNEK